MLTLLNEGLRCEVFNICAIFKFGSSMGVIEGILYLGIALVKTQKRTFRFIYFFALSIAKRIRNFNPTMKNIVNSFFIVYINYDFMGDMFNSMAW